MLRILQKTWIAEAVNNFSYSKHSYSMDESKIIQPGLDSARMPTNVGKEQHWAPSSVDEHSALLYKIGEMNLGMWALHKNEWQDVAQYI